MKINNVFFVLIMVMSYGCVFAMKHEDQEKELGDRVENPYFLPQVQQYYGPHPKYQQPDSHLTSTNVVSRLVSHETMIELIKEQNKLLAQVAEKTLVLENQQKKQQEQIIQFQENQQSQAQELCNQQKQIMQLALNQAKSPQEIIINANGGTSTASSNPTTTTTQDIKQETKQETKQEVKVENNVNFAWDSKMQLRIAVLLTALSFGFYLNGPEGSGLAFLLAAAMLCAVHSIENKAKTLTTFTLMTITSAIAAVQSKDKDLAKLAGAFCVMSGCGTVLVGVLAP